MVCHFKTIQWKKRKRSLELTPFKTPSQQRWEQYPSRWTLVTWTPDPWYLMKPVHITHPSITIIITSVVILTQVTFIFTSCSLFTQRIISGGPLRGLYTYRLEDTSVWTSLHQNPGHWHRTHIWTFSIIVGNVTPSTLQAGEINQSKSQIGFQHYPLNSFQDPFQEKCNLVQTDSSQDPCIFVCGHNPFILTPL